MRKTGVLFLGLLALPGTVSAQKATPQIQQEINKYIQSNNQQAMSGYILNGILNDIAISYFNANTPGTALAPSAFPALQGDCTTSAGSIVTTCLSTNGVHFTSAATTLLGTSGATIPLLNGTNTWSGTQTFPAGTAAANLGFTPPKYINVKDYGAILDGASHPVSGYFANAAAAEAVCPSLTTLVGPNVTIGTLNGTAVTTGTVSNASSTITTIASMTGVLPGATVTDSGGYIPAGTIVSSVDPAMLPSAIHISNPATGSLVGDTLTFTATNVVSALGSLVGIVPGAVVTDTTTGSHIPGGTTVVSVAMSANGATITLSNAATASAVGDTLNFAYPWGNAEMDWCATDAAIRNVLLTGFGPPSYHAYTAALELPKGVLRTNLPLNFTCINDGPSTCPAYGRIPAGVPINFSHFNVVSDGGEILCTTYGLSCIDGIGSTNMTFYNVSLYGSCSTSDEPGIGFAFGRTSLYEQAGNNHVINGNNFAQGGFGSCFSSTPYYNEASEGDTVGYSSFYNLDAHRSAWGLILDGGNHFYASSAYVPVTSPHDTPSSLQGFVMLGGSAYPVVGNSDGIFAYGTLNTNFLGTYVTTMQGVGITFYTDSANSLNSGFNFNGNIESPGTLTADVGFVSASASTTVNLPGFTFNTGNSAAASYIFSRDTNTTAVNLLDPNVRISQITHTGVSLFDNGAVYTITDPNGIHIEGPKYQGHPISGMATAVNSTLGGGSANCTGLGSGGACSIGNNSTVSSGTITLLAGSSGAASSGVFNLAFPFKMGSNPACTFTLSNGSAAWASGASITLSALSVANMNVTWVNNATVLAASATYTINYVCSAQQ